MTSPDDTPPWLTKAAGLGEPVYWLEVGDLLAGTLDSPATLPEWLAWRSRVAEALGLVEPPKPMVLDASTGNVQVLTAAVLKYGDARAEIGYDGTDLVFRVGGGKWEPVRSVNAAIAAELRRLADRMEAAGERFDKICRYEVVDGILRHRANELDSP